MIVGYEYPIQEMVYVKTVVNVKSVVARIVDEKAVRRSYFLPEIQAEIFRKNYKNVEDFDCLHKSFDIGRF